MSTRGNVFVLSIQIFPVSNSHDNTVTTCENVFYFFYKITRRKLENSLLYQSVNSPYYSRWRMRWRIMARIFPCFPYSYRNTGVLAKLWFSKCYFSKEYIFHGNTSHAHKHIFTNLTNYHWKQLGELLMPLQEKRCLCEEVHFSVYNNNNT